MILKLYTKQALWRELLKRETFDASTEVEATTIWRNVFNRTPELSDFLKRREIQLLKSTTLQEKPSEFILGQISENRLWQRFDVILERAPVENVIKSAKTIRPVGDFLKGWAGVPKNNEKDNPKKTNQTKSSKD